MIFTFLPVSVSFFISLFSFYDSPSPLVILTKKWLLTNIFTSIRSCFCVFICLFLCLFWGCSDYSRTNEQIFIILLWIGPGQRIK